MDIPSQKNLNMTQIKSSAQKIRSKFKNKNSNDLINYLNNLYTKLNKINPMSDSKYNFNFDLDKKIILKESNYFFGLMIEFRKVKSIEKVIKSFFLKIDSKILIVCSENNHEYIKTKYIKDLIIKEKIFIYNIGKVDSFSPSDYNKILLSKNFWELLPNCIKVIVFQTDSLICKKSKFVIDDFKEFDYIGSAWDIKRPIGLNIKGGSGGLSLRDLSMTKKVLKEFCPYNWPGGEDGYFAFHMELIGGNVASYKNASKFSTQTHFHYKSFGCHKVSRLYKKYHKDFYKYCPESTEIENPFSPNN